MAGNTHGGPRQNSGRKPTNGPMVAVSVRLTKPEHARLQAVRAQGLTCRQVLMQGVANTENLTVRFCYSESCKNVYRSLTIERKDPKKGWVKSNLTAVKKHLAA